MNHISQNLTPKNLTHCEKSTVRAYRPLTGAGATRIALIGGFTPRRCGIATFTADIYDSVKAASPRTAIDVYAMARASEAISFGPAVCATIMDNDPASYRATAQTINQSGASVVWLQHEFGLFGGPAGNMILELVNHVAAPLIVTLHTVLHDPDQAQLSVMKNLIARASKLIVMSQCAASLLDEVYGADKDQIVLIQHGVPDRPFGREDMFKQKRGWDGKKILMTFGLLSPGKGIEAMISALPAIVEQHPDVLYCIVGATHPNLLTREGEAYRQRLKAQATSLGVADHVHWIDAFLENEDLLDLIEAADIYVTPYPGAAQSTSGTLSYAVALGKAVVSTPYVHASELLAHDHGVLVPFNDSGALAREIGALLADPERLLTIKRRAYARGRSMIWPEFARRCLEVVQETGVTINGAPNLGPPGIEGLLRICDDTGILQHSVFGVPNRAHGYCVDDNARALMLANRLGIQAEPHGTRLSYVFAAFIESAWNNDTQNFRNFMDFRRNWLEDAGSEDSCGRTIWALGATAQEGRSLSLRQWARHLFDCTAPSAKGFGSP
ncbi:MAG: glycosyltransferase family 4 protein, partial [Sphingobium sp.]